MKKNLWINCTKFVTIFMLFLNHTSDVVYSSAILRKLSVGSVGLFVLLSGYTLYDSWKRRGMENLNVRFFWRKVKVIIEAGGLSFAFNKKEWFSERLFFVCANIYLVMSVYRLYKCSEFFRGWRSIIWRNKSNSFSIRYAVR